MAEDLVLDVPDAEIVLVVTPDRAEIHSGLPQGVTLARLREALDALTARAAFGDLS